MIILKKIQTMKVKIKKKRNLPSRRGKQKETYGNSDRNYNKNDFKDKRDNKRDKPKSGNEKLPHFESNFNEEDKLKEFNANRDKKSSKK